MKQKLFLNQLSGRWLAVGLALLLMPAGLLAQTDYGLNVAGVAVTSDNASNVLGDEIVSVSYNNAANTLTLRGAYISGSNITVDESISALTLHLVGQSCIYLDNDDPAIYFANDNPSLTITTSETLPGSLVAANLSNVTTPVYSNGLSYNDGIVSVSSLANTELAIFTGKDSYTNTDNGDNSYIYSGGKEFYASYAVGLNNDSKYAQVQTKKNETTATMWPSSYDYPQLRKVILQIGACTAADVTVQVKGITEDQGSWVSDGTTYSEPIALSSANADGILEIPLENFSSKNVQLVFSSASSFSFIPITIAFVSYQNYNIAIGGIAVTEKNAANITGNGITGSVSYDNETHTLTLNNATIVPEDEAPGIDYFNDENLTIALIGDNTVQGLYGCEAIRYNGQADTPPYVYFVKGDANHFSLVLVADLEKDFIGGFRTNNEGLFFTEEEGNDTHSETISSSMFGGTGSADEPFLIKTPNDLKDFAANYNEGRFSNNVNIQLFNDINCEGLTGFTPIADNSDASFCGVFDGNNKTISNLDFDGTSENASYTGLFGIIDETAVIKNLTLSNCNFSGGENAGAIVAYLQSGTIQDCNVTGCSVETRNAQSPNAGGVAGYIYDGTIQRCNVTGSTVNGTTTYSSDGGGVASTGGIAGIIYGGKISACEVENTAITSSHALPNDYQPAGGIVGNCYFDGESATTVSGNAVKGTTTVSSIDNNPDSEGGHTLVGAIVGFYKSATLSNNTYEYTVTVSTRKQADNAATTTAGYTHRGLGGSVEFDNDNYPEFTAGLTDLADNNGAVMYTQTVTVPAETEQATVTAEENTYYTLVELDNETFGYAVAPGQTVTLNVTEGGGYVINTFTATNTTTNTEIGAGSEDIEDNLRQYTFTMPDAPVTVAVTAAAAYGVTVAGVEVTELNYTDVLGDGKVSFTLPTMAVEPGAESTPATLTLNGATINGNVVSSLTAELDIHLLGSNVIDAGEDCAFVSTITSSYQMLKFTTVEATPGQLLIKADPNGYKEQFNDSFENGLTLNFTSGKRLIGVGAELTPKKGLFWTDQQFTVTGPTGSTLYYRNNMNSQETAYTEPFKLTAGKYNMVGFRKVTVDETEFSLYGEGGAFIVHAKPGFSVVAGTYNEAQNVTLTGLPNMTEGQEDYPQVWYYLGENADNSVRVYSAEDVIEISESTKVSVYILDQDSGKVFKSSTVEAEYVIRKSPELRFYTSEQSYLSTGNTVNVEYGEEYASPVLKGKIGNEYTATLTDLGIVYSSSDEHVATISQTGQITIVGGGFATITATSQQTDVYSADNTSFTLKVRPAGPAVSLAEGAYYTGQELTLQRIGDNGTVYYSYGEKNADERTVYQEAISLPKGCYDFYPYTRCGTDEQNIWSYGNAHRMMYVYDQPQISHASGTYDGSVEVEITNLPESGTYAATVYYYFDDDEDGAVVYEAGSKITITEDKTLKVYIYVEGDSAKNFKTAVIEREYVVRQDAGIAFVKNDEPVETADYTIGGATAQTLPTLQNENGLTVTYTSEDTDVATVNATTGAVTPVGVGVTSIIASWNATATLMAGQATYLLHVYKDLTHESITVTVANATFTGEAVEPEVTVMDGETDITGFVHLAFSNNVEVGTNATVTVTPNGQLETNYYTGSTSETFAINYRTLVVGEDVTFANGQKWASYYNQEETLNLPEGVMAYIVTAIGETAATVAPISYVPVNVPVLIEKDSETTTSNTSASGNLLQGAAEAVAVSSVEGTVYGLYNNKMMRVNKGTIPAGRAYLVSTSAAPARELTIGIDTATGIRFVEDGQSTTDQWYTIDGRKLQNKPTKDGLYIKNGKTVVVNNK